VTVVFFESQERERGFAMLAKIGGQRFALTSYQNVGGEKDPVDK
jgi:NADH:ubiquinone oxidoreductase subunit D